MIGFKYVNVFDCEFYGNKLKTAINDFSKHTDDFSIIRLVAYIVNEIRRIYLDITVSVLYLREIFYSNGRAKMKINKNCCFFGGRCVYKIKSARSGCRVFFYIYLYIVDIITAYTRIIYTDFSKRFFSFFLS